MAKDDPTKVVSPKVKHGGAAGLGVGMLITIIEQASAKFDHFAGDWTQVVYMAIVLAVAVGVGYIKRDPKRVIPTVEKYLGSDKG
jgi:hypothetical protein